MNIPRSIAGLVVGLALTSAAITIGTSATTPPTTAGLTVKHGPRHEADDHPGHCGRRRLEGPRPPR